jgi:hypothetical protein
MTENQEPKTEMKIDFIALIAGLIIVALALYGLKETRDAVPYSIAFMIIGSYLIWRS